ncbi:hypothetical protein [Cellulomonas fengjieae]|uniref:hypothetical protein n=1 Tax=Cellulomonas fengjieae TaxID=2819978 RepID=UPI001AB0107A|nr:hypothetical protein [Cellulomonas fengjieae]MBO3103493.1 hypothetical protein [Cellulomonas fengjieae]
MAYLGDFLGTLNREIALARVQGDVEAVRIAEIYAHDPLLKHFPVPRFRLPTLSVRVPVAVQRLDAPPPGTVGGVVDGNRLRPLISNAVDDQLTSLGATLPIEARRELDRVVGERVDALVARDEDLLGERAVADDLAAVVAAALPESTVRGRLGISPDDLRTGIRERLRVALVPARVLPPRLEVLVTDTQLREASDNVIELNLTLTEEAVEWTVVEQAEGGDAPRLVPE